VTEIETECKPNLSLSGVLVYISGGRRPPLTEITTECKPNLSLGGVLVYISGGQRPPGEATGLRQGVANKASPCLLIPKIQFVVIALGNEMQMESLFCKSLRGITFVKIKP